MAVTLRPPKEHVREILRLIEECGESLHEIVPLLESSEPRPLRPESLTKLVSTVLPSTSANVLVKQLLSMIGISRRLGLSPKEISQVVDALKRPIEEVNGRELPNWDAVASTFVKALKSKPVQLTALAVELSYEYANLLRNTRILTDIRPLFDEDASEIEAAVISFTLRLRYDSADGEHDLSIVLDEGDVKKLAEQCERALKKAGTARKLMEEGSVPAIIAGQSSGDDDA